MKKLFTLCVTLCSFLVLNAQSVNAGMKLLINSPSDLGAQFATISAAFGGTLELDKPVTGKLVPTKSKASADPILTTQACDSVLNGVEVVGNFAFISRGTCSFVIKCLNAQKAGAKAIVVMNNAAGAAPIIMGGSDPAITVPCCMVSREDGIKILDAIKAGKMVNVSMVLPSRTIAGVYGAVQMQTPFAQRDTILPYMQLSNQGADTIKGVNSTCIITDPAGKKVKLESTGVKVAPGASAYPEFALYYPAVKGKYSLKFYSSYSPNDTLFNQFEITDFTFSNDFGIGAAAGAAFTAATFGGWAKSVNILGYYSTGPTKGKATFATFGINNATALKGGRTVNVGVYKADETTFQAAIPGGTTSIGDLGTLVSDISDYTVATTEKANTPIFVKLTTDNKAGVDLEPNSIYILAVQYDGSSFKDSICPTFSLGRTFSINHPQYAILGTAMMVGAGTTSYYNAGFSDSEDPIARLHTDGFVAAYGVGNKDLTALNANEVTIAPNPATNFVNVKLDLNEAAKDVKIGIMDMTGRVLSVINVGATQKDNVQVDVSTYAPGTYFMTILTEKSFSPLKFVKQ
jgi:hypothetical protein